MLKHSAKMFLILTHHYLKHPKIKASTLRTICIKLEYQGMTFLMPTRKLDGDLQVRRHKWVKARKIRTWGFAACLRLLARHGAFGVMQGR